MVFSIRSKQHIILSSILFAVRAQKLSLLGRNMPKPEELDTACLVYLLTGHLTVCIHSAFTETANDEWNTRTINVKQFLEKGRHVTRKLADNDLEMVYHFDLAWTDAAYFFSISAAQEWERGCSQIEKQRNIIAKQKERYVCRDRFQNCYASSATYQWCDTWHRKATSEWLGGNCQQIHVGQRSAHSFAKYSRFGTEYACISPFDFGSFWICIVAPWWVEKRRSTKTQSRRRIDRSIYRRQWNCDLQWCLESKNSYEYILGMFFGPYSTFVEATHWLNKWNRMWSTGWGALQSNGLHTTNVWRVSSGDVCKSVVLPDILVNALSDVRQTSWLQPSRGDQRKKRQSCWDRI